MLVSTIVSLYPSRNSAHGTIFFLSFFLFPLLFLSSAPLPHIFHYD